MEISIKLGGIEESTLIIKRNWFTGSFEYFIDGKPNTIRSALDVSTHYSVRLKTTYEFNVGDNEVHAIRIEHTRPLFFAGFRPQKFDFFVNGKLNKSYAGY